MGRFPSYVPKSVMDKFGADPKMKEHLEIYHGLRKHGGDIPDAELIHLFDVIHSQQSEIERLTREMRERAAYTISLERMLEKKL